MAGTLSRLRMYLFCDLSSLEVDYILPLSDYPDYPRDLGLNFYSDTYKSALGSNFWRYNRGTSSYWNFTWEDVSDDAYATMGIIVASSWMLSPHVVIYEAQGIDGIGLGSLQSDVTPVGTYFVNQESWNPKETQFGLWSFNVAFTKES